LNVAKPAPARTIPPAAEQNCRHSRATLLLLQHTLQLRRWPC
jgi:hypothetical protein